MEPLEIVGGGPFAIYYGPSGEAEPEIDDSESTLIAGNWNLLGLTGAENYADSGIKMNAPQTVNLQRVLGATGPVKAFRDEEDLQLELDVLDLTVETYAWIMTQTDPTTQAAGGGNAGSKYTGMYRGFIVGQFAVLLRIPSAHMDGRLGQFWIPRAVNVGSPEPTFIKGAGAALKVSLTALVDTTQTSGLEFGRYRAQTALAS